MPRPTLTTPTPPTIRPPVLRPLPGSEAAGGAGGSGCSFGGGGGGGSAVGALQTSASSTVLPVSWLCSSFAWPVAYDARGPAGSFSRYMQKYFNASTGLVASWYSAPMFESSVGSGEVA